VPAACVAIEFIWTDGKITAQVAFNFTVAIRAAVFTRLHAGVRGKRLFCESPACLSAIIALVRLDAAVGLRVPSFVCCACGVCCVPLCASPRSRTDRHSISFVPSSHGVAQIEKSDIVEAHAVKQLLPGGARCRGANHQLCELAADGIG
jgi:hypothetical protein